MSKFRRVHRLGTARLFAALFLFGLQLCVVSQASAEADTGANTAAGAELDAPSCAADCAAAGSETATPGHGDDASQPHPVVRAAGMRAYVDPETGLLTVPESPEPLPGSSDAGRHARTALPMVDSPVPGGGQMVDVRGLFRGVMRSETKPDGHASTSCDVNGEGE